MTVDPDTEQRILDAANAVFLRRGTAGARMQEIATEAGVNKALLHYYFRSKDRLAEAVFQRAARRLLPPMMQILSSDATIEEKVRRAVEHELTILSETPFLPGYLISEMTHHPERLDQMIASITGVQMDGLVPAVIDKLDRQIKKEVRAGTIRPIATVQFISNLIALCIFPFAAQPMLKGVFGWEQAGFDRFIEERKRSLPDFFLNALRP